MVITVRRFRYTPPWQLLPNVMKMCYATTFLTKLYFQPSIFNQHTRRQVFFCWEGGRWVGNGQSRMGWWSGMGCLDYKNLSIWKMNSILQHIIVVCIQFWFRKWDKRPRITLVGSSWNESGRKLEDTRFFTFPSSFIHNESTME